MNLYTITWQYDSGSISSENISANDMLSALGKFRYITDSDILILSCTLTLTA